MCLTLVTASIMNTTLVRCKEIEKQNIITVNTRVLNDPLTQVHVCWSNKSPKCVLSYEYTDCSRAIQNNLTGAIVPELVFIPNAAPRRKKLLILFDHYKRLATLIWQANLVRRCPLLILYRDGNFSAV